MAKEAIFGTLVGSNLCHAGGHTVQNNAPALEMCRVLVAAGYDPERPLWVFRGNDLAMKIKSIGWGAQYTVAEEPSIHLVRHRPLSEERKRKLRAPRQD